MIYNVVLVSAIQQSESVIHTRGSLYILNSSLLSYTCQIHLGSIFCRSELPNSFLNTCLLSRVLNFDQMYFSKFSFVTIPFCDLRR